MADAGFIAAIIVGAGAWMMIFTVSNLRAKSLNRHLVHERLSAVTEPLVAARQQLDAVREIDRQMEAALAAMADLVERSRRAHEEQDQLSLNIQVQERTDA